MTFPIIHHAIRNLIRYRHSYLVSLIGLTISLTVFFLIANYIHFELNWESQHKNIDRLFLLQVENNYKGNSNLISQTPSAYADYLKDNFPEIENTCLMLNTWGEYLSANDQSSFYEGNGYYADSSIYNLFSYDFIEGSPVNSLLSANSIVLSENLAKKIFPGKSALGQTVFIDKKLPFIVEGVYKDMPENTSFQPSYLCSFERYKDSRLNYRSNYKSLSYRTFVMLYNQKDLLKVNAKIENLFKKFTGKDDHLILSSLKGYHISDSRTRTRLTLYASIGILIVILSIINCLNNSLSNFYLRLKEFNIKKIIGANKKILLKQVFAESLTIVTASSFFAVVFMLTLQPYFYQVIGYKSTIASLSTQNIFVITLIIVPLITFIITLIPVFSVYSKPSNNPHALKLFNNYTVVKPGKPLVIFQFFITIALICVSLLMYKQYNYIDQVNLGLNNKNIIYTQFKPEKNFQLQALKREIKKIKGVDNISFSYYLPFHGNASATAKNSKNDDFGIRINEVGPDYLNTLDIVLIEGRNFTVDPSAEINNCLINQAAEKKLGLKNPVGHTIFIEGSGNIHIIGVVHDFQCYSMYSKITPTLLLPANNLINYSCMAAVKLNAEYSIQTINQINKQFNSFMPLTGFEFWSYTDKVNQMFGNIALNREMNLLVFFTIITIIISLVGFYSIVAQHSLNKTKEIGIRKINGAKTFEIAKMLNQEFIKWLIIAYALAIPVAVLFMRNWLNRFAYKTQLSWWIFIIAGFSTLIIALITASSQNLRAARKNPVEALRYE